MGVMARKSGETFIITSDRVSGEVQTNRVAKKRLADVFQVWTGDTWSPTLLDAKLFAAIHLADEYIRANFARVMA